jgi:replicative DNA helicase
LAYPIRYNSITRQWEQTGSAEKVLFIITEQTFPQIRKMILAYLSDINDARFKLGHFTKDEEERLDKAIGIMEQFADNLTIIKMPNPTIELVKTLVRENCLTRNISYVFYDYIFIGPALLNEFRGFSLRNDEVLLMFATALKDLAVELNVAMFTSTQVNASADDNKNIRNEASLAGGRSTINKADNGAIMARPTNEELETLQPLVEKYGTPNMVTDIFKARSGEWTQVRIWSVVNLGTMKKKDLFVTDSRLEPIDGFFEDDLYEISNWDDESYVAVTSYVNYLNERT